MPKSEAMEREWWQDPKDEMCCCTLVPWASVGPKVDLRSLSLKVMFCSFHFLFLRSLALLLRFLTALHPP